MKSYAKIFEENNEISTKKRKAMKVPTRRQAKNEISKFLKEDEEIKDCLNRQQDSLSYLTQF